MSSTAGPQAGPQRDPGRPAGGAGREGEVRRGLRPTVRDMVASMAVIMLLAVAGWGLVPRPNAEPIRDVDVAGAAERAAPRLTFAPAVPQGLPEGWVPTSAGLRDSGDGLVTWHIGYVTPDGHSASIEQAAHATQQWEVIMDSGGVDVAARQVDGTTWAQRFKDVRDVTALIHRGEERTTMVTSKGGGLANAELLARSIPATQR